MLETTVSAEYLFTHQSVSKQNFSIIVLSDLLNHPTDWGTIKMFRSMQKFCFEMFWWVKSIVCAYSALQRYLIQILQNSEEKLSWSSARGKTVELGLWCKAREANGLMKSCIDKTVNVNERTVFHSQTDANRERKKSSRKHPAFILQKAKEHLAQMCCGTNSVVTLST